MMINFITSCGYLLPYIDKYDTINNGLLYKGVFMDFEQKLYYLILQKNIKAKEEYIRKHGKPEEMNLSERNKYRETYGDINALTIRELNDRLNCGGYALQIDGCIYPNSDKFSNYISALLERFPFVRLLGDEPLKDDEYLVFYRFSDYEENGGINDGHHFIRVDDDGLVVEKNNNEVPQIFSDWEDYFKDSPEAVFAVKKEHNALFDESEEQLGFSYWLKKGLDFNGSVSKAIKGEKNQFSYHCHNYRLKKSEEGLIVVVDDKGEIVADVIKDSDETCAIVRYEKLSYVENLTGPVKPIIKNGRLVNLSDFKQKTNEHER